MRLRLRACASPASPISCLGSPARTILARLAPRVIAAVRFLDLDHFCAQFVHEFERPVNIPVPEVPFQAFECLFEVGAQLRLVVRSDAFGHLTHDGQPHPDVETRLAAVYRAAQDIKSRQSYGGSIWLPNWSALLAASEHDALVWGPPHPERQSHPSMKGRLCEG
jgi:hypothetical protein